MSADPLLSSRNKEENNHNVYTELEEKTNQPSHMQTSKDEKSIELAVIKDEAVVATTELIIGLMAWTNASVLHTVFVSTFYVSDWSNIGNGWLLFLISLIAALSITMFPLFWIDVHSDAFKKLILAEHEEKNDTEHPFFAKAEYLLQASLGFVVSMTLRDLAMLIFEEEIIESRHLDSAAYILYAVVWTLFGIWVTIHITNKQNRLKKYLIQSGSLEGDTRDQNNNVLMHFAIKQRYTALIVLTITYVMAWSWRGAIDSFILAMYGGTKWTTSQVWVYCLITTVTIAFFVSLSVHFYCLYPRDTHSQALYGKSQTVKETNQLVYENCKFVVGFAWFDAIKVSVYSGSTQSIWFNVFVLYWLVAFALIFVSIYATHKFNEKMLKEQMKKIGVIEWVMKTKTTLQRIMTEKNMTDGVLDDHEQEQEGYVQYEAPVICSTFAVRLITLTFESWSVTGAVFVAVSVMYTVLAVYDDVASYSVSWGYDRDTTGLWLQWVFALVVLCLTALVMLHLRRITRFFRSNRTDQTKKLFTAPANDT
eukprot:1102861_1